MNRWTAFILLAAGTAACSPQAQPGATAVKETPAAAHPVSGLAIVPLTVRSGERLHRFRVEVAATGEEQNRGLMFRNELGPDEGMIFPTQVPEMRSFWMKNTPLPLDIIFIGPDRRIVNIAARTTPYSTAPVASTGPVVNVLEIPGGRAEELGIAEGDLVEW